MKMTIFVMKTMEKRRIIPGKESGIMIEFDDVTVDMMVFGHPKILESKSSFILLISLSEVKSEFINKSIIVMKPSRINTPTLSMVKVSSSSTGQEGDS